VDDGRNPTGHRANRVSLKGSVYWMAPEVVKQTAYTLKADIWSVGCLVVEMFTGIPPFGTLNPMQAIFKVCCIAGHKIRNGHHADTSQIGSAAGRPDIPNDISSDAVDFLQRTFEHNYEKRPSAGALLEHPFIVGEQGGGISLEAANATLSAVAAARKQPMPGLSGLGLGMKP
jgi:mitogen-activated protein kinase kinase kinase